MCEFFFIAIVVSDFVPFPTIGDYLATIEGSIEVLFDVGAYGMSVCHFSYS